MRFGVLIFAFISCVLGLNPTGVAAELKRQTITAFDRYVAATEARINSEERSTGTFLYVDGQPTDVMNGAYAKLRKGEVLVEKRETNSPGVSADVPDEMVHHWVGIIFIPGATLAQVLPIVRDYDRARNSTSRRSLPLI